MQYARDIYGAVFKDGSATLLARVVRTDGTPVRQVDIAAAKYTVFEMASVDSVPKSPIDGHDQQPLDIGSTCFDTLQTDSAWSIDEAGYNFRHELDVISQSAFPAAGKTYQVRYELIPTEGQPIAFRFLLDAI